MSEPKAPSAKAPWPFHPLLVGAFPTLATFSVNLAVVPLDDLWRPLGIGLALGGAALLLMALIWRNWAKGAACASALVASWFLFDAFCSATRLKPTDTLTHVLWAALGIGVAVLAGWRTKSASLANLFASILCAVSIGQISWNLVRANSATKGQTSTLSTGAKTDRRPDVIYIVLDGYGRTDAIKASTGYDDSWFIKGLEERGFYVAKESVANYCQTRLSVASSLHAETIQVVLRGVSDEIASGNRLFALVADNSVSRAFRDHGYVTQGIGSGFPEIEFTGYDLAINAYSGESLLEQAVKRLTPLGFSSPQIVSAFDNRRNVLTGAFAAIQALTKPAVKPRFTFAHILAPHPPFVFDADGQPLPPQTPFGFFDGSDYTSSVGTRATYKERYAGQAEWTGKQVLETVDALLKGDGEKPIIIIQGDHGPKSEHDQNELDKTNLKEVFPILNAYFVPEDIRASLYPSITPVNSFRVIFNGLFDARLPLLEDRSWYSPFAHPTNFVEVTDRMK